MIDLSPLQLSRRSVFFDRDGVINRSPGTGYVLSPDEFILAEGIGGLLKWLHTRGWLVIIVTSQRCVGKEIIDLSMLGSIHGSMQKDLKDRYGSNFVAIYAFTDLPGTESWSKPRPGMIVQACKDYCIDPSESIMIGDQDRDIEMAQTANIGCTIRVLDPEEDRPRLTKADECVETIDQMIDRLKSIILQKNDII